MKRFQYLLSLLMLCLGGQQRNVAASLDAKVELGEKFGNELKMLTKQLAANLTESSVKFYEEMLKAPSISVEETQAYKASMDKLNALNQRFSSSNDSQIIIESVKELKSTELRKISKIDRLTFKIKDSEKYRYTRMAMENYNERLGKFEIQYIVGINEKWHELLVKVPAAEQMKHQELLELNELIERLAIGYGGPDDFSKVMEKISNTFGYDDWELLLVN